MSVLNSLFNDYIFPPGMLTLIVNLQGYRLSIFLYSHGSFAPIVARNVVRVVSLYSGGKKCVMSDRVLAAHVLSNAASIGLAHAVSYL